MGPMSTLQPLRRLLLLTLLVPLLGLPGLGLSPAAAACPEPPGFGKRLDRADYVFTGIVDSVERGDGEAAYALTVRKVYAGDGIVKHETVYASTQDGDCRLQGVQAGETWLIVASGELDRMMTSTADGSRELDKAVRKAVEGRLGEGAKPEPDQADDAAGASFTDVSDGDPEEFWPLSLPGFILVGAGLVVLAAARGLSRRADRHS